ncbi:MAG: DUF1501 domain-containing protein [Planctomycetaceae bacterium]|nr:DUF1501 domain-containing protein [Planctomycetaceae bacterium]
MQSTRCSFLRRRDVLQIGVLSSLGLALPGFGGTTSAKTLKSITPLKSCILLWLDGGPSHLETWDLKPQAPTEVRGPFRSIRTKVPGIEICEHLRATAQLADKFAILRSVTSPLGEHGLANHYLLTGYEPSPSLVYPSYGAVIAKMNPHVEALPPYVAIPNAGSAGAGFLSGNMKPFSTQGDPAQPGFRVNNLEPFSVDAERLVRRRAYLKQLEEAQAKLENSNVPAEGDFDRAFRLMTSPEAKAAFELEQEPDVVRQRYGPQTFGQSCLLARRLVERGVPFVTVNYSGWDTHADLVLQLESGYSGAMPGVGLLPTFDLGFSALLRDLAERNLLDQTLLIVMGEFGRTPKLNAQGGRDHWPRVFSVVMAGGGIRGGQVIGSSDRHGESPMEQPITPRDLAFSIYKLLGLDPSSELITPAGRPVPLNQGGQWIKGLT